MRPHPEHARRACQGEGPRQEAGVPSTPRVAKMITANLSDLLSYGHYKYSGALVIILCEGFNGLIQRLAGLFPLVDPLM